MLDLSEYPYYIYHSLYESDNRRSLPDPAAAAPGITKLEESRMKRAGLILAALAVLMFSVQAMAMEKAVMAFYGDESSLMITMSSSDPFGAADVDIVLDQSLSGGYAGETEFWYEGLGQDDNNYHVIALIPISPIGPERELDLPNGVWNILTATVTINYPDRSFSVLPTLVDSLFTIVDEPAREGSYTYASECEPDLPPIITRGLVYCAWLCHGSFVIPVACEDPAYYPDPNVLEVTVTNGCDPAETHCNDPDCDPVNPGVLQWFKRVRPNCVLQLIINYCDSWPGCVCIWRSDFYLPVEMLGFSAVSGQDRQVTLNWATASEVNTEKFIITRADSRDGMYRTVGNLNAAGTTSERNDYTFVDADVENGHTYFYKLHTRDLNGNLDVYNVDGQAVVVQATPSENPEAATYYALAQNYPNPFNSQTNFSFSIPAADHVTLKVFDLTGREVATVVNEVMSAGAHTISWNAHSLPTGVYMYSMTSGSFSQTMKLLFLK